MQLQLRIRIPNSLNEVKPSYVKQHNIPLGRESIRNAVDQTGKTKTYDFYLELKTWTFKLRGSVARPCIHVTDIYIVCSIYFAPLCFWKQIESRSMDRFCSLSHQSKSK